MELKKILGIGLMGMLLVGCGAEKEEKETAQDTPVMVPSKPQVETKVVTKVEVREKTKILYRGIYRNHLEEIVDKTLLYLGVKNRYDWTRLLMLTIITESDCGRYLKQIKGPARGIAQTELETEKDILRWTRIKYPTLYKKIKDLRIPARLEVHEAQYNIAYSVALAYLEYLHRKVNPIGKSTLELAKLHKVHYNTYLGKATVDNTIKKVAMEY